MASNRTHLYMIKQQNNLVLNSASMHRPAIVATVAVSNTHVVACVVA
jgi:hypothetical protein